MIKPDQTAWDHMGDFVRDMHTSSGLIAEIPNGKSLAEAEYEVLEYILKFVPAAQSAPLAGNTIGTDRMFLAKYMPRVDSHLHYRSVDVSSIKELTRHWFPRIYFNAPAKNGGHRALADILESIRELAVLPRRRLRERTRTDLRAGPGRVGHRRRRGGPRGWLVGFSSCTHESGVRPWWA